MSVVKDVQQSINEFITTIQTIRDYGVKSLPQAIKPYLIESPLFIQQSVFLETEVLNEIISSIYDIYLGFVLVAINLDTYVDGVRKVRDVLATVSTSGYLGTTNVSGSSSFESIKEKTVYVNYYDIKDIADSFIYNNNLKYNIAIEKDSNGGKMIEKPLISGRFVSLKIAGKDGEAHIPVFIKLNPRVFPDEIVTPIIKLNVKPDIAKRWLMWKAGEIRFFKDFILQLDILSQTKEALRKDKSNVLYELLVKKRKGILKRLFKFGFLNKGAMNLANTIFIFEENSLKQATNEAGINFDRYAGRNKFFEESYTMMVVSVDNSFNLVKFYIHAIQDVAEYSFQQLLKGSKKQEIDIVELMRLMAEGHAPKL